MSLRCSLSDIQPVAWHLGTTEFALHGTLVQCAPSLPRNDGSLRMSLSRMASQPFSSVNRWQMYWRDGLIRQPDIKRATEPASPPAVSPRVSFGPCVQFPHLRGRD